MQKTIALFNHKGGVSKTTTTFNVGWMLAEKGHRVVMKDRPEIGPGELLSEPTTVAKWRLRSAGGS